MRDAIEALQDLCEQTTLPTSRHGVAVLSAEGEYLSLALDTEFPPTARLLLSTAARLGFEGRSREHAALITNCPSRERPIGTASIPGLTVGEPIWDSVIRDARKEPCEESAPILFVPEIQQIYLQRTRAPRPGQEETEGQEGT